MRQFKVTFGLGGGFGTDTQLALCVDEIDAENYARILAIEVYESYEGLHDIRGIDDIMEEECDEGEADVIYQEERESWLNYSVEEVK